MRMSELVSSLDLWLFPAFGLLWFVLAFTVILLRVFRARNTEMAANGRLPLEDGSLRDNWGSMTEQEEAR